MTMAVRRCVVVDDLLRLRLGTTAQTGLNRGVEDVPRMEKSPLLANGYNHPPTHLSHMQFMQLGGHPGAGHTAILSPASLPHHLQAQAQARAEQGLKVNPNMTNIEALARTFRWNTFMVFQGIKMLSYGTRARCYRDTMGDISEATTVSQRETFSLTSVRILRAT
ncbi:Dachshund like protein 2 [Vespula maculifrons]|uniref:Uncharacterized protein n=2 Tax=Vespula TaxID=7451 RepID=A0A834MV30_VESGE|nr:hypothetical protein HZH68_013442 [Vespula germanica]